MALGTSISTREADTSVSESVTVVVSSTREGYASVGELLGYDSVFHDRDGYTSVSESVAVGASSTREGYASVGELIGYDSIFHQRTAFAGVADYVIIPPPVYSSIRQASQGWGTVLTPEVRVLVSQGGDAATISVSASVGVGPNAPGADSASVSVFEGNVVGPQ